jgi:hypothetical protein
MSTINKMSTLNTMRPIYTKRLMNNNRRSITKRTLMEIYGFMNLKPITLKKFINEYGEAVIAFAETVRVSYAPDARYKTTLPQVLVGMIFSFFIGGIETEKEIVIPRIHRSLRVIGLQRYIPRKIAKLDTEINKAEFSYQILLLHKKKDPNNMEEPIAIIGMSKIDDITNKILSLDYSLEKYSLIMENFNHEIKEHDAFIALVDLRIQKCGLLFEQTSDNAYTTEASNFLNILSSNKSEKLSSESKRADFEKNYSSNLHKQANELSELKSARALEIRSIAIAQRKYDLKTLKFSTRNLRRIAKGKTPSVPSVPLPEPDLTGQDIREWPCL